MAVQRKAVYRVLKAKSMIRGS